MSQIKDVPVRYIHMRGQYMYHNYAVHTERERELPNMICMYTLLAWILILSAIKFCAQFFVKFT